MFKKKRNKTYASKLTKRRKRFWKIKVVLASLLLTGSIVYISNLWDRSIQDRVDETVAILTAPVEELELSIWEQISTITGGHNVNVLYNLAKCESGLKEDAVGTNTNMTSDLGFYQINTVHKDISNACKMDLECSTRWTNNKINEGYGHIWVCWNRI